MLVTMPEPADGELAARTQAGSLSAFEDLVRRYERRLLGYLQARVGNVHDAEDLTQRAFINAYRGLASYDTRRPFAAWLFTIARRLAIDHHRARRPTEPLRDDWLDHRDPARAAAAADLSARLWTLARQTLTGNQFTALWLNTAAQLDVKATARTMGKSETHVKVLLFRARRCLGRRLAQEPDTRQWLMDELPDAHRGMSETESALSRPHQELSHALLAD